MRSCTTRLLLFWLVACSPCLAGQVEIAVANTAGTPLPGVLVIVQELQPPKERELFRALTDERGNTEPHSLPAGLYRAIATSPYSRRQTEVREFLVQDTPVKVALRMRERIVVDEINVSVGRLAVRVVNAGGGPVAGARVLVRDSEAHPDSEQWGTTDARGVASVDLTSTVTELIVVYGDQLYASPIETWQTERTIRLK